MKKFFLSICIFSVDMAYAIDINSYYAEMSFGIASLKKINGSLQSERLEYASLKPNAASSILQASIGSMWNDRFFTELSFNYLNVNATSFKTSSGGIFNYKRCAKIGINSITINQGIMFGSTMYTSVGFGLARASVSNVRETEGAANNIVSTVSNNSNYTPSLQAEIGFLPKLSERMHLKIAFKYIYIPTIKFGRVYYMYKSDGSIVDVSTSTNYPKTKLSGVSLLMGFRLFLK